MTQTITRQEDTGEITFLFRETVTTARHRQPEPLFAPESTTMILPAWAEPAPVSLPTIRVYNPASMEVERPLLGHGGEHRRPAPTWALLVLGAGLGLLGLAAVAGLAVLAVVA
jgi:hypothetical protein